MVGLGCGARSYTRRLHYSSRLRGRRARACAASSPTTWPAHRRRLRASPSYGFALDDDEQRRRYAASSRCCRPTALDLAAYRARFGADALRATSPSWTQLAALGLVAATTAARCGSPTAGLERVRRDRPVAVLRAVRALMAGVRAAMNLADPLPRPARELQLRLRLLPVRQAARTPRGPARDRPRCAASASSTGSAAPADDALGVLFTPWGEAPGPPLVPRRAWRAHRDLPHVARVAIQTNLSAGSTGSTRADPRALALWCTYHPGQTTLRALPRAAAALLDAAGVRYSVGVVGLREHLDGGARAARARCRADVYLWVNAAKARDYTAPTSSRAWPAIDPLFPLNTRALARARAAPCRAGERAISVDGDGTVRRCHFVREPIGNLYDRGWRAALAPRAVHQRRLRLPHRLRAPRLPRARQGVRDRPARARAAGAGAARRTPAAAGPRGLDIAVRNARMIRRAGVIAAVCPRPAKRGEGKGEGPSFSRDLRLVMVAPLPLTPGTLRAPDLSRFAGRSRDPRVRLRSLAGEGTGYTPAPARARICHP